MKLNELRAAVGATHSDKRVGRGHGSGWGKTSTRGANGQGQRSGSSTKVGFEGGQMPLYRRLPKKKHFRMPGRMDFSEINVGELVRFSANAEVNAESLVAIGILSNARDGVRVLGNGDVTVPLTLTVHHISASARQKVEAAGGTVTVLPGRKRDVEVTEG